MHRNSSPIILIILTIAIMTPVVAHESTRSFANRTVGLELYKKHNGNANLGARDIGGNKTQKNLAGKWLLENTAKNLGDGIEMHVSGDFDFDSDGTVQAIYRVVTSMSRPDDNGKEAKSVYLDLLVDGTGKYSLADGIMHVDLDKKDHSYKIGEGTYDSMGPEYQDADPMGQLFVKYYFGVLVGVGAYGFKDMDIKDIDIRGDKINGSLMGTPVTLIRVS